MDWLKAFELGPLTQTDLYYMLWFWGAVAGYCIGRGHAAFIILRKLQTRKA